MKKIFDFKSLVIAGLFVFIALYINNCTHKNETEALKAELHKNELRNDVLKKISVTQYEKMVADTVTKRDLMKLIKDLEIKVDNPKIITRIEYKQRDVEKPIDGIIVKDNTVNIEDYYPSKEKQTLKYTAIVDVVKQKGIGKFEFKPQTVDLVFSETTKGFWKATLKTDSEFVELGNVDVQALPSAINTEDKKNNWGTLGGLKYNTNSNNSNQNIEVMGGFRYKKVNVIGSANTNSQLGVGLILEF
jgi:hypothetical protein